MQKFKLEDNHFRWLSKFDMKLGQKSCCWNWL